VLFERPDGKLTEGSRSSLFVQRGGQLVTPPLSLGLMPSVFRQLMIDNGRAVQRDLTRDDLAGAFFTATVGTLGARFVWEIAHTDQVSPDLDVPMWIVFLAVPLGSYLMFFRFLQVAWTFLRTGELPHHDHGHVEGIDELKDEDLEPAVQGAAR